MNPIHARQQFLGERSEEILSRARVLIAGAGGSGSHVNQQIAYIGDLNVAVVDDDTVDFSNLNRLVGASTEDAKAKVAKVDVAERVARLANPKTKLRKFNAKFEDVAQQFRDYHVIFGCVDTYAARDSLERFARRFNALYIDIGMDVHRVDDQHYIGGQVVLSSPGAPCLWCMGILTEERLAQEARKYGDAGGRPQVIWPNGLLASAAVGIAMQVLTPWHKAPAETVYLEYDGNRNTLVESPRLAVVRGTPCTHYSISDVGDPFYVRPTGRPVA